MIIYISICIWSVKSTINGQFLVCVAVHESGGFNWTVLKRGKTGLLFDVYNSTELKRQISETAVKYKN